MSSKVIEALALLKGSATVLGVPRTHHSSQLSNFNWSGKEKIAPEILSFVEDANAGQAPHLILSGGPGLGKTHIAVGLYRWAVNEVGTLRAAFVNATQFYSDVKKSYGDGSDPLAILEAADFLVVLDDILGLGELRPADLDILIRTLNTIYSNGAALVITMNPMLEELSSGRLGPHEVDRILDNARVCHFKGQSWRGQ